MDKNIDDIFDDDFESKIQKELKIKRRKLNRKLILLATLCTLILLVLCNLVLRFASRKYIYSQFHKDLNEKVMEYQVKHPNEYICNQKYYETGYFKFQSTLTISKVLGNKHLLADSLDIPGGLSKTKTLGNSRFISMPFATLSDDISLRPNTSYSLRSLIFMYPYVDYDKHINDFSLLSQIDNSKTVEMALSFDDKYSYDEINNLINSDIIKFYWVDDNNITEDGISYNKEKMAYTSDNSVIGIKSTFYDGTTISDTDDRLERFKESINYFKENPNPEINYDIDLNNIKINGIVVTGSPEELSNLQNIKIIKHSVLGNIVDKF